MGKGSALLNHTHIPMPLRITEKNYACAQINNVARAAKQRVSEPTKAYAAAIKATSAKQDQIDTLQRKAKCAPLPPAELTKLVARLIKESDYSTRVCNLTHKVLTPAQTTKMEKLQGELKALEKAETALRRKHAATNKRKSKAIDDAAQRARDEIMLGEDGLPTLEKFTAAMAKV